MWCMVDMGHGKVCRHETVTAVDILTTVLCLLAQPISQWTMLADLGQRLGLAREGLGLGTGLHTSTHGINTFGLCLPTAPNGLLPG